MSYFHCPYCQKKLHVSCFLEGNRPSKEGIKKRRGLDPGDRPGPVIRGKDYTPVKTDKTPWED